MVWYERQRPASTVARATIASVGQAVTQRLHLPQRSGSGPGRRRRPRRRAPSPPAPRRSRSAGDEAAVRAHVAEPRARGPHLLHHRVGVDRAVVVHPGRLGAQAAAQRAQPVPQRRVVVAATGVAGDGRAGVVAASSCTPAPPPSSLPAAGARRRAARPPATSSSRGPRRSRQRATRVSCSGGIGSARAKPTSSKPAACASARRRRRSGSCGGSHGTSFTPARWLATRAMVKSRSERRLR